MLEIGFVKVSVEGEHLKILSSSLEGVARIVSGYADSLLLTYILAV
jgi:hypothetical protein